MSYREVCIKFTLSEYELVRQILCPDDEKLSDVAKQLVMDRVNNLRMKAWSKGE